MAALCISLTSIIFGANLAMTSSVLYEFEKDIDEFLKMTMEEASWLRKKTHQWIIGIDIWTCLPKPSDCSSIAATLNAFATIIGFSIGGLLSDHYGKKLTVFVFNLLTFASWIFSATATTKWFLCMSYSLQGFFGAIAYNCVGEM